MKKQTKTALTDLGACVIVTCGFLVLIPVMVAFFLKWVWLVLKVVGV